MYRSSKRKRSSEQVVPGAIVPGPSAPVPSPRPQSVHVHPFDDADYPIPDFHRIYALMRHPSQGLPLADRRWRFLTYSKCFVGERAVQWFMEHLPCDHPTAIATGQRLIDAGVIHHVTNSEPFSDAQFFYRFQEDDDTNILNMKRVWDASIPQRAAVEVSKDLLTRLAFLCEEHRKHILAADAEPSNTSSSDMPSSKSSPNLSSSHTIKPSAALSTNLAALCDDVDYSTLARSDQFRQYALSAAELQRVQPADLNHDERIAFFANVYNALCLHAHVVQGPPNSVLRRYTFFRALSYRVAGLDFSLDDIEHGILRVNKRPPMIKFLQQLRTTDPKCHHVLSKRDGRIHFVISAGTRSDPPIRILDSDNVQEELHDATVEFLSYTVKVDSEKRSVTLPRILYWYAEDFPTPEKSLLLWVAQYLPTARSAELADMVKTQYAGLNVLYENFDWSNAEARFNASVVRRKRRKLERERSSVLPGLLSLTGSLGFGIWGAGRNAGAGDGGSGDAERVGSGMKPIISPEVSPLPAVMVVTTAKDSWKEGEDVSNVSK